MSATPAIPEPARHIVIVGAGPAGLAAAEILATAGCVVTVTDRMPTAGRKLLMAGKSGLNLTNAEPEPHFLTRYGTAAPWLAPALADFTPKMMVAWAEDLGLPCFTGSSGRIFPKAMKASPLLRAWLARLNTLGVIFRPNTTWTGWNTDNHLTFTQKDGSPADIAPPDATILALGGASWSRLGSDGSWATLLLRQGIPLAPFRPANCGFHVVWSDILRDRFAGTPLKRIALTFNTVTIRGEAIITRTGIEGGALYALSAPLRDAIEQNGPTTVFLDLRPDLDLAILTDRFSKTRARESLSNRLRKAAQLPPVATALLREAGDLSTTPADLARRIKALPIRLTAPDSLDRAISTAGGVPQSAVDSHFMLHAIPGIFVCGEMLDWEAPTGGYLLQACMATGRAAALGALNWLNR
ncbi:TIGR03862 family flavoprotein [Acetobacter fallax]|uniref:TIGR03862 family flavoprotein n=1 Tax=Acetobacter fallax TaxID=1737473 RepID=A0ABX0KA21_9PROT|nr:TIGR03862 family flavoprotein [Acetobacter fallax]NHO31826.1 TIGR03862 family flavoprotein [Acetobacter fallax]NHO35411.1 TIGR03862 family flavoprotein [Acetobacter fallax]